jgi:hypothetical protein
MLLRVGDLQAQASARRQRRLHPDDLPTSHLIRNICKFARVVKRIREVKRTSSTSLRARFLREVKPHRQIGPRASSPSGQGSSDGNQVEPLGSDGQSQDLVTAQAATQYPQQASGLFASHNRRPYSRCIGPSNAGSRPLFATAPTVLPRRSGTERGGRRTHWAGCPTGHRLRVVANRGGYGSDSAATPDRLVEERRRSGGLRL